MIFSFYVRKSQNTDRRAHAAQWMSVAIWTRRAGPPTGNTHNCAMSGAGSSVMTMKRLAREHWDVVTGWRSATTDRADSLEPLDDGSIQFAIHVGERGVNLGGQGLATSARGQRRRVSNEALRYATVADIPMALRGAGDAPRLRRRVGWEAARPVLRGSVTRLLHDAGASTDRQHRLPGARHAAHEKGYYNGRRITPPHSDTSLGEAGLGWRVKHGKANYGGDASVDNPTCSRCARKCDVHASADGVGSGEAIIADGTVVGFTTSDNLAHTSASRCQTVNYLSSSPIARLS